MWHTYGYASLNVRTTKCIRPHACGSNASPMFICGVVHSDVAASRERVYTRLWMYGRCTTTAPCRIEQWRTELIIINEHDAHVFWCCQHCPAVHFSGSPSGHNVSTLIHLQLARYLCVMSIANALCQMKADGRSRWQVLIYNVIKGPFCLYVLLSIRLNVGILARKIDHTF